MRHRFVIPSTEKLGPSFAFAARAEAWNFLRYLLDCIAALFGPHGAIVKCIASPEFRADMFFWLRPAEKLARVLLLAEAADIKIEFKGRAARAKRLRRRLREDFANDNAAAWRVSFAMLPRASKHGSGSVGWQVPCLKAQALAARVEALVRVLNNPAAYAKRLAIKLHRTRSRRVAKLFKTQRIEKNPLDRAHAAALHLAQRARIIFDSG